MLNQADTIKSIEALAEAMGAAAFRDGTARAPCQDRRLMEFIKANRPDGADFDQGVVFTLPALKAWNRGYHRANAAAPI